MLEKAYDHTGVVPTLLERDFNIPPLAELAREVDMIRARQKRFAGHEPAWRTATSHV